MNPFRLLGLLAFLTLATPLASGATGPYAGIVAQGQTASHEYDNRPSDEPCPDYLVPATYTVALKYSPPHAVLTLEVESEGDVEGAHGSAVLVFEQSPCTRFGISVTGTHVHGLAAYTVFVLVGQAPPSS